MPIRRPLNKRFKLPTLGGETTLSSELGQVTHQTYEEERNYLFNRKCIVHRAGGYLPTPEQIAEEAAIIREENEERERIERLAGRAEYRTPYHQSYRLDTTGMGARRGKLI